MTNMRKFPKATLEVTFNIDEMTEFQLNALTIAILAKMTDVGIETIVQRVRELKQLVSTEITANNNYAYYYYQNFEKVH